MSNISRTFKKMSYIAVSKSSQFKLYKSLYPFSIKTLPFCSLSADPSIKNVEIVTDSNPNRETHVHEVDFERPMRGTHVQDGELERPMRRTPKGKLNYQEKVDVICRMMANRAWTTRLQNSFRSLVSEFNDELVYNVLDGARNAEHALQFFRWVERAGLFKHDRKTHCKIIEILGRASSKLNHARCILLDMPKKGVEWDEELFVKLIDSYGKASIVQESVKLFQKMTELGVPKSVKAYDTLFKVIMRRGRYRMAKRYFNKMLGEGIVPTVATYNVMIWGFFLSKRVKTATRFFEEMKSKEILPNDVTYNTMINGYYRIKKVEEAEKYFAEMKERAIVPNVITYTTMIKGYVEAGQVDKGLGILEEMKSSGMKPNAITYSTLLPGVV